MGHGEERNSHILSHIETKTADYANRIALGIRGKYGWKNLHIKAWDYFQER